MQFAAVSSRALLGMECPAVTVEAHVSNGLPTFSVVGMPETAVRESRDRVRSAIRNSGFDFPEARVVVNLAPADLVKQGARFDLAIAVAILAATDQITRATLPSFELLGELGLDGGLKPINGVLPAALHRVSHAHRLVIPARNHRETALLQDDTVIPCAHLNEVVERMNEASVRNPPPKMQQNALPPPTLYDSIVGQATARRALEVAAAGGHHMLLVGPPGTGKTMLARSLAELLPKLSHGVAMEVAAVYSAAGMARDDHIAPPFRDPHHAASAVAIAGGGRSPMPGEVSLAHGGVLFLDELPHFAPTLLNLLREPLESRSVTVARAAYRVTYPARFQFAAAMNPCPAGRICSAEACRCSTAQIRAYQNRVPGPLLDRIDLQCWVAALPPEKTTAIANADGRGMAARQRVQAARERQMRRQGHPNADLAGMQARRTAPLDAEAVRLLEAAVSKYRLSTRGYHKVIKVTWTIADLEGCEEINQAHVAEALSYRALDWENLLGVG